MKIIITESQAEIIMGNNKISCNKCKHSWKKEKNDKHPYLCHTCGWDNKSKKYNDTGLFNFWSKKVKDYQ